MFCTACSVDSKEKKIRKFVAICGSSSRRGTACFAKHVQTVLGEVEASQESELEDEEAGNV